MGVEQYHCVIATTWDDKNVDAIQKWVSKQSPEHQSLFSFVPAIVNESYTIILAPDGSKEGWSISNNCDKLRDAFIAMLKSFDYSDGSNPFSYVEVSFGELGQEIVRGNCNED